MVNRTFEAARLTNPSLGALAADVGQCHRRQSKLLQPTRFPRVGLKMSKPGEISGAVGKALRRRGPFVASVMPLRRTILEWEARRETILARTVSEGTGEATVLPVPGRALLIDGPKNARRRLARLVIPSLRWGSLALA
jgi:hypothetical protein